MERRVVPRGCATPFCVRGPLTSTCSLSLPLSALPCPALTCSALALLAQYNPVSVLHLFLQCCSLSLISVSHLHHRLRKKEKKLQLLPSLYFPLRSALQPRLSVRKIGENHDARQRRLCFFPIFLYSSNIAFIAASIRHASYQRSLLVLVTLLHPKSL
jgi:hypothetical protein